MIANRKDCQIQNFDDFRLYTPWDLQEHARDFLLERRKAKKLSRRALAEQTGIPAPTIRRFEETCEISFRQFCNLWSTLADEVAFIDLMQSLRTRKKMPRTMKEVLESSDEP